MGGQERIRVLVVEDHEMVAQALATALGTQSDLAVVGIAGTLQGGVEAAGRAQPDVVLMDRRLPDGDGARGAVELRARAPLAAVLVITAEVQPEAVLTALESGCAGVLPKSSSLEQLARAVRDVHRGDGVFSRRMLASALPANRPHAVALTEREREILQLLHEGATTAGISRDLVLSVHTVRNHVRNLSAKLGAHTRIEALARARAAGLLDDRVLSTR